MLLGDNVARPGFKLTAQPAAPRTFLEGLARPRCLLDRRNVFPLLVVAGPVSVMQRVEHLNVGIARGLEDLTHVPDTPIGLGNSLEAVPDLAALGNEVVVRVNHHQAGDASAIFHLDNFAPGHRQAPPLPRRFTYEARYVT